MEKYIKAIELAEHPEKFTDSELLSLLEDTEIREIYDTICQVDSAFKLPPSVSPERVDAEWRKFASSNEPTTEKRKWHYLRNGRSVAAVAIAVTSITALAFGVGLMSRHLNNHTPESNVQPAEKTVASDASATGLYEAIPDSTELVVTPVIFENESLGKILREITQYYGLDFEVMNNEATNVRLYYRWNPADDPSEVVRQLNSFDRIRLVMEEKSLILK